ncbi:MAG: hypothetical protein IPM92_07010 [Saprospiraceae bacterium]|nr:hypothetical protein [Saprospiraceae bacterium]
MSIHSEFVRDTFLKFEFKPGSCRPITQLFLDRGIHNFFVACNDVKLLPYRRIHHENDPGAVLTEHCGTCSSKHALLKTVAAENQHDEVRLMLGIYRMNEINTPEVKEILKKYQLNYLPEAHNYLKIHGEIFDFTKPNFDIRKFSGDIIFEHEILPENIVNFKTNLHKNYLNHWIQESKLENIELEDLWMIRELCIQQLIHSDIAKY